MLPTKSFERRLNTKIVVKSQKCSMSAERKSAGRTTPICSEEQPGVFGMSKKSYRWRPADLRIAGSQAANLRTGSRPAPDRGRARGRPIFCRLNAREVILNFTRSAGEIHHHSEKTRDHAQRQNTGRPDQNKPADPLKPCRCDGGWMRIHQ